MPPIYVMGENDDADMQACNVRYASAIATVEAALRFNRISIGSEQDYFAGKAIKAYTNINIMHQAQGCIINVEVTFKTHALIDNPVVHTKQWADIVFCSRAQLRTAAASLAQAGINGWLTGAVNECISEYAKAAG